MWRQGSLSTPCPFQPEQAGKEKAPLTEGRPVTPVKGQSLWSHLALEPAEPITPKCFLYPTAHIVLYGFLHTRIWAQGRKGGPSWGQLCNSVICFPFRSSELIFTNSSDSLLSDAHFWRAQGSVDTITLARGSHLHHFPKSDKWNQPRAHFDWETGSIKANYFGKEARGFLAKQAQTSFSFAVNHFLLVPVYLWRSLE